MSQIEERFKFSCRLYIIIKTIYIWCKKRMFFDNFPHFLITFLAALPPCRQCFHRTGFLKLGGSIWAITVLEE